LQITIRPVSDLDAFHHFQNLERSVWQMDDDDIIPIHIIVTVCKNGGMLLGAYAEDGPKESGGMVGTVFGWLGLGTDREGSSRIKMCSDMLGVYPTWQGHGIGRKLKLAQRDFVLAQGQTDWITWTYDPLYLPNGILNIHRLGATCNTYQRNIYGIMQDALNAGAPSDRCQVDWYLQSNHVDQALAADHKPVVWPAHQMQVLPTQPAEKVLTLDGRAIAMPIPVDIGAIRRADPTLGQEWRLYMRQMLEQAFAGGYTMVDCARLEAHDSNWYYILESVPV